MVGAPGGAALVTGDQPMVNSLIILGFFGRKGEHFAFDGVDGEHSCLEGLDGFLLLRFSYGSLTSL